MSSLVSYVFKGFVQVVQISNLLLACAYLLFIMLMSIGFIIMYPAFFNQILEIGSLSLLCFLSLILTGEYQFYNFFKNCVLSRWLFLWSYHFLYYLLPSTLFAFILLWYKDSDHPVPMCEGRGFPTHPRSNTLDQLGCHNSIQFWHYLPGYSIRFHSLRVQTYKTVGGNQACQSQIDWRFPWPPS